MFPVITPEVAEEPIVMPVITSFGTVTDDTESKKRTDPTTGYESEYAKFLANEAKDVKRCTKDTTKLNLRTREKKRKPMVNKVFVVENDDSSSGTALETKPDPLSEKPKIFVKNFAHFSG